MEPIKLRSNFKNRMKIGLLPINVYPLLNLGIISQNTRRQNKKEILEVHGKVSGGNQF